MKAYIKKICYYLPSLIEENEKGRLADKTGIYCRHICAENENASDLAIAAAEKLFSTGISRENIDFLLYCTQSPDYILPTTACILQDKLHLSKQTGALDYNLGCSGYIYGLSLAKGLIESGQVRNVLLITSETYSKYANKADKTVRPLFGDAATATYIEACENKESGLVGFVFGTDGSGYDKLIVPVGGMANKESKTPLVTETDEHGNTRSNRDLAMDGAAISEFARTVVPATLDKVLALTGLSKDDIDYFVFHQANKFMLKFIQKKADLLNYPYWNDVSAYGNTVSSSIPIAICDMLKENEKKEIRKIVSIGFGVGLSWAGCVIDLSKYEL